MQVIFTFFQTWENQADCVIFLFSFVDRGSFEEISQHITRMTKPKNNFTKLVIGTKYPLFLKKKKTSNNNQITMTFSL